MDLDNALKTAQESMRRPAEPLWKGPEVDGVTQSLLSRWLVCRERFRLLAIEGLRPRDDFNHRLEYGSMWHACEETVESELGQKMWTNAAVEQLWQEKLADYCEQSCSRYPLRQGDILKWVQVCAVQFPAYLKYWKTRPDSVQTTNLLKEKSFDVPYRLPSGRTVRLRGKWDSVDFIPAHRDGNRDYPDGIWLQENKTKGDINPASIRRQMRMDLQTMIYLVALNEEASIQLPSAFGSLSIGELIAGRPILGVRYNVVRRPLSGGRHSIVQHKATRNKNGESESEFYTRLAGLIDGDPGYFFMRWKCDVAYDSVDRFRRTCLDPILEQLCDWYEAQTLSGYEIAQLIRSRMDMGDLPVTHFTFPYGVYNPLTDGGTGDVDEFLETGSLAGLQRVANLFPELT